MFFKLVDMKYFISIFQFQDVVLRTENKAKIFPNAPKFLHQNNFFNHIFEKRQPKKNLFKKFAVIIFQTIFSNYFNF